MAVSQLQCNHSDSESGFNSILTGFGPEDSLQRLPRRKNCGCGSTATVLHLYKETYLSEFETEEEKAKVRLNLGVPSKAEVNELIKSKMGEYATKADVDRVVAGTLSLQNYYTKDEVNTKIDNIEIDLDSTPIYGSSNGVTSGGVWKHVDDTVGEIHRFAQTI